VSHEHAQVMQPRSSVQHVIIETLPTPHLEHQGAQSGLVREPIGRLGG
jgi:hypothetical protein